MASRKRKAEDVWEVSDVEESGSATVHGVVSEVSPVKVSRKNSSVRYFDGKLTDGKKTVRMICFEPSLRSKLETSRLDGSTVAVANCQVKPARGGGVEIMATSRSEVSASPRKMNVTVCGVEEVDVELRELNSLATNTDVSVCIKVISVAAPDVVRNREGSE